MRRFPCRTRGTLSRVRAPPRSICVSSFPALRVALERFECGVPESPDFLERLHQLFDRIAATRRQLVDSLPTHLPRPDQARPLQYPRMFDDSRPADREAGGKLACAALLDREAAQKFTSRRISQRADCPVERHKQICNRLVPYLSSFGRARTRLIAPRRAD